MRIAVCLVVPALLLGCASSFETLERKNVPWHEIYPELLAPPAEEGGTAVARKPTGEERKRLLTQAEAAWRTARATRDDAERAEYVGEFRGYREELADDPLGSFWLARMLIAWRLDVQQQGRPEIDAAPNLSQTVGEAPWVATENEIVAMGGQAASALIYDLVRKRNGATRGLGVDLLSRVGPGALPSVERARGAEAWQVRKELIRAVSLMDPVEDRGRRAVLEASLKDEHWSVRGEAWIGIARDPDSPPRLRAALKTTEDPYVRRKVVEGLGGYGDDDSINALIAFLEDAIERENVDDTFAAQRALESASGRRNVKTVDGWRLFLRLRKEGR